MNDKGQIVYFLTYLNLFTEITELGIIDTTRIIINFG